MVGAPWIHRRMIRSCACGFMVHKALAQVEGIGHEPPLRMVGPCGCGFMVGAPWNHSRMIRSCEAMAQLPPVLYSTVLYWIMDQGSRIKDLGPCSGMNDHPGRDTDVISRPSKSTIKDLSFYIGFTWIQSSNKHVGPCYGMNGHSRRDPDTISRLPDTTSHFLSVFIGFRCSNKVKMVILIESMNYYRKIEKIEILFCPGDHSRPF